MYEGLHVLPQQITMVEQELQQLTSQLARTPTAARLYVQRGMALFKLGQIPAAIADFDQAERLNPDLTPYLWQRGLAYYYAERFADGAQQFEIDLTVNGHDVEETVWRYLCQAQLQDAATARAALLPVRRDRRLVMGQIYQLFAGECTVEALLTTYQTAEAHDRFYSQLYAGLYYEAARDVGRARELITQAAAMQMTEDYMGWLALVHQQVRGWGAAHTDVRA